VRRGKRRARCNPCYHHLPLGICSRISGYDLKIQFWNRIYWLWALYAPELPYMRLARPRLWRATAASATNVARWCLSLVLFPQCQPGSACAGSKHSGVDRGAPLRWPRAEGRLTFPGAAAHTERGTGAAGRGEQSPGAARQEGASQLEGCAARRCLSYVGPSAAQVEEIELDVSEARKLANKMRRQRQLEMSFPAAEQKGAHQHPVVMRVYIDQELRTLLKLAGRERRGRVVVDATDPRLAALTAALEARFPIGAVPYRLQARWQRRVRREAPDEGRQREALSVSDDNSVARLFELASGASSDGIRVELYVLMSSRVRVKDERPSPEIINLLKASSEWCMVSFYLFVGIEQPVAVAEELQTRWSKMGILGRTYVAEEGINAQLAVLCVGVCVYVCVYVPRARI